MLYPTTYPTGVDVSVFLGGRHPAHRPDFDRALDAYEVQISEDGGLIPLYRWSEEQYQRMGLGDRLVSGAITFNHAADTALDRTTTLPDVWGHTLWLLQRHTRMLPNGTSESIRDLVRIEFCFGHPVSEEPDPFVRQVLPFTARRMTLVERQVARVQNDDVAQFMAQTGPVQDLFVERERVSWGRVVEVSDADTVDVILHPDGEKVTVRVGGPDAPETPKSTDGRETDPADWVSSYNNHMDDDQFKLHLELWAVYATNQVRKALTPAAGLMDWDGTELGNPLDENGAVVRLVDDPGQAPVDIFGRSIYRIRSDVFTGPLTGSSELDVWLITNGLARPYPATTLTERGEPRLDYLRQLADEARVQGRGAWGADAPPGYDSGTP